MKQEIKSVSIIHTKFNSVFISLNYQYNEILKTSQWYK